MKHLTGIFETGATNAETNDFILSAMNDRITYDLIMNNTEASKVFNAGRNSIFKHIPEGMINWPEANEYFQNRRNDFDEFNQT